MSTAVTATTETPTRLPQMQPRNLVWLSVGSSPLGRSPLDNANNNVIAGDVVIRLWRSMVHWVLGDLSTAPRVPIFFALERAFTVMCATTAS